MALASTVLGFKRNFSSYTIQTDYDIDNTDFNSKMVRIMDETDSSTNDETSSLTSFDSATSESTSSESNSESSTSESNSESNNYESLSDGGRDYCNCYYDYRADFDEIFCPRCRRQVPDDFEFDDQDEIQELDRIFSGYTPRNISREVKPRESDDSFDTWPSASEEEVLKADGDINSFRRSGTVKKDLQTLTGHGPIDENEYEGDIDDDTQRNVKRKKLTKKVVKRKKLTKTKQTGRSKK